MEKATAIKMGDKRLDRVLDKINRSVSEKQTLSLRKLSNARKEEVQFGKFVGNAKVSLQVLEEQRYAQMRNHGPSAHCLLIESDRRADTSKIGFSLERAIDH